MLARLLGSMIFVPFSIEISVYVCCKTGSRLRNDRFRIMARRGKVLIVENGSHTVSGWNRVEVTLVNKPRSYNSVSSSMVFCR
jgi:hypothetical protein